MVIFLDILIFFGCAAAVIAAVLLVALTPSLAADVAKRISEWDRIRRARAQLRADICELASQTEFLARAATKAIHKGRAKQAAAFHEAAAGFAGRAFALAPALARLQS